MFVHRRLAVVLIALALALPAALAMPFASPHTAVAPSGPNLALAIPRAPTVDLPAIPVHTNASGPMADSHALPGPRLPSPLGPPGEAHPALPKVTPATHAAAPSTGPVASTPFPRLLPFNGSYSPHAPIRIVGDVGPAGLILGRLPDGTPLYRPGSGIVAGNGTPSDPFVISGWQTEGIMLQDTHLPVAVQGNLLVPTKRLSTLVYQQVDSENTVVPAGDGVVILDGGNVTVSENVVRQVDTGIIAASSADVLIQGNLVAGHGSVGILVSNSTRVTVANNTLRGNGHWADPNGIATAQIEVYLGSGNVVRDNEVTGRTNRRDGDILVVRTANNRILGNVIPRTADGRGLLLRRDQGDIASGNQLPGNNELWVSLSHNDTVADNVIESHRSTWDTTTGALPFEILGGSNDTLRGNRVVGTAWSCLRVYNSPGDAVVGSDLTGCRADDPLLLDSSPLTTVSGNTLSGLGLIVWDDVGVGDPALDQRVDGTNLVNGAPLLYAYRSRNVTIHGLFGELKLDNPTNATLRNVTLAPGCVGVVWQGQDLRLENVTAQAGATLIVDSSSNTQVDRFHGRDGNLYLYWDRDSHVQDSDLVATHGWSILRVFTVFGSALVENTTFVGAQGREGHAGLESDTTALVLRNVAFRGAGLMPWWDPPTLDRNVTVNGRPILIATNLTNAAVGDGYGQVILLRPQNVTIEGASMPNTSYPVFLYGGGEVTVKGCNLGRAVIGVFATGVTGVHILQNNITASKYGIDAWNGGSDNEIRGNHIQGPGFNAVQMFNGPIVVADNTIQDWGYGVADRDARLLMDHNTLRGVTDVGVYLGAYRRSQQVLDNVIADGGPHATGILVIDGTAEIDGNDITGNGAAGVRMGGWDTLANATGNWWGCASGPNTAGCDRAVQDYGYVTYDPWLAAPNPDAGAPAP